MPECEGHKESAHTWAAGLWTKGLTPNPLSNNQEGYYYGIGLLGPNSIMVVYMDPQGNITVNKSEVGSLPVLVANRP